MSSLTRCSKGVTNPFLGPKKSGIVFDGDAEAGYASAKPAPTSVISPWTVDVGRFGVGPPRIRRVRLTSAGSNCTFSVELASPGTVGM